MERHIPFLRLARAIPGSALASDPTVLRMVESQPLGHLITMTGGRLDITGIGEFLDHINGGTGQ
jgi:beta-glucosidase